MTDTNIDVNANVPTRETDVSEETTDQANVTQFTLLRYKKCLKDMRRLAGLPDESPDDNLDRLHIIVNELKGIAERLNKLAEKDDKAVGAVRRGALVLYTEILNLGAVNEQTRLDEVAANGIAIFSWTCYERTRKERGCVNGELTSL